MNGAGNDFIVIDNRFFHFTDEELADVARRYCRRRFGIGADGVLAFNQPRSSDYHFRMRYLNADGTIGTMCGNGARCLARFARRSGIEEDDMLFETDAGAVRAYVPEGDDEPVRIYLDAPRDFVRSVELITEAAREAGPVHYLWSGTEHAVCFVSDVSIVPVSKWGPAIRNDPALAPRGANVDFVEVMDGAVGLRARTFEKGVEAETYACGTGAIAAAVTARLLGHHDNDEVAVAMRGGTLTVGMSVTAGEPGDVYLEGPAEVVYRGTFEF